MNLAAFNFARQAISQTGIVGVHTLSVPLMECLLSVVSAVIEDWWENEGVSPGEGVIRHIIASFIQAERGLSVVADDKASTSAILSWHRPGAADVPSYGGSSGD